jgi:hypothetical protein
MVGTYDKAEKKEAGRYDEANRRRVVGEGRKRKKEGEDVQDDILSIQH